MQEFFDAVIKANQKIANLLQYSLKEELFQATTKGAGGDISLKIDLKAEEIFIEHLRKFGDIISEEKGFIKGEGEYKIIVDPIDGSDNLVSNLPYYGTSVALLKDEKTIAAVVVNLANGDIFIKNQDGFKKAKLDDLTFEQVVSNSFSKVGIFERSYCSTLVAKKLKENLIKYRSPGAFALSLTYAHDVEFVLYEGTMREYDIAAGEYFCDDLYMRKTNNIFLVSKNKETFDKISKFIL